MCEADALSGTVLSSGSTEQVEDTLMIPGINPSAIVANLENGEAELGATAD
jgi:hypothetical protein